MKRRQTKTNQREVFRALLRTIIGWGIGPEEAAKSLITSAGGLLISSLLLLCGGGVLLLDPTCSAQWATGVGFLLYGLVALLVWMAPLGGCLRAWWVGRRGAQQATRQFTGRVISLHRLPSPYLGTRPNLLVKIETPGGTRKLFLVSPRLTSRLRMSKTVQIEYVPSTEFVVAIQSVHPP